MNFDQTWMTDLFELQKKAMELAKGKNPAEEVQNLVLEALNKWGITNLPWTGELDSTKTIWSRNTPEPVPGNNLNIEISETKNSVQIRALIPGVEDPKDLSIRLQGDLLYISGKSSHFGKDGGSFTRKIHLPAGVTTKGAEASYKDESLTLILPKVAADEGESIPVDFGGKDECGENKVM